MSSNLRVMSSNPWVTNSNSRVVSSNSKVGVAKLKVGVGRLKAWARRLKVQYLWKSLNMRKVSRCRPSVSNETILATGQEFFYTKVAPTESITDIALLDFN